jgi:hypothetical protein
MMILGMRERINILWLNFMESKLISLVFERIGLLKINDVSLQTDVGDCRPAKPSARTRIGRFS